MDIPGRKIIVVIQPDFPQRHAFGLRKQSLELLQIIRRRILGFVWMHACRGINKIILLRQIQAAPRGRQITAHAGAARYARLAHARDGLGAI